MAVAALSNRALGGVLDVAGVGLVHVCKQVELSIERGR